MRTLVAGGIVAGAIAAMLVLVTTGGENGWKIALAGVGLVLWILGGLSKNPDPSVPGSGQNDPK
ncbi:MAG TPA: hypothetical protein VGJ39_07920 [Vicinamibacterales bacterium]